MLNLCASISSARLDQKHVVTDFLMCIDDAIHAFHGYIKNQSNGSDFKHKRMHISEFGQMALHASSVHTNTHTLSLSHSLTLSPYIFLSPPPHSQISVCLMIGLCHIFYCPHWAHSLDEYMALFQYMFMSTCMPICMPLCKPCRWNTSQAFGPPFPPALLFWYDNR